MQTGPLATADNIALYEKALDALKGREGDNTLDALTLKHKAVLALARAGATDFAQSEYERYGLNRVKNHEDIMALAGRLAKDRFETSGDIEEARASANFYEAAFQSTGGYYSAINAATMSLLAKVPSEIVMGRAQAVLSRLSSTTGESDEERYFIHASRAEAHYILGDKLAAQASLQMALDFDPLNYTAHASTYRQFSLLAKAHSESIEWLKPLRAPLSVQFAGHLFSTLEDEDRLSVAISDMIQKEDIGFGYGALAAGSDIVFAETLLEEGGELHVILPVASELFKHASVTALEGEGTTWTARYERCLARASSVRIISKFDSWPHQTLNNFAARIAMGQACLKAEGLSSLAGQLLIWDNASSASLTAQHASDWQKATASAAKTQIDRPQFVLDFPGKRPKDVAANPDAGTRSKFAYRFSLAKNGEWIENFTTAAAALESAATLLSAAQPSDSFGLDVALIDGKTPASLCQILSQKALPGGLLVSQDMAALITLEHSQHWRSAFTAWIKNEGVKMPAYFAKTISA